VIEDTQRAYLRALGLALLAGLGAFPTALLMIGAVVLGHRIDLQLGMQYPVFLCILLAVAVPLSILTLVLLARAAIRAAHGKSDSAPHQVTKTDEEDKT
jgi:hypothetical protein